MANPIVQPRITRGDVNTLLATDARQFDVVTAFDAAYPALTRVNDDQPIAGRTIESLASTAVGSIAA